MEFGKKQISRYVSVKRERKGAKKKITLHPRLAPFLHIGVPTRWRSVISEQEISQETYGCKGDKSNSQTRRKKVLESKRNQGRTQDNRNMGQKEHPVKSV